MPLVEAKQVTHVVCYDQDRWARNEYARLKWQHEVLEPKGVDLLIVDEGHFEHEHDRELYRGLKGNVAQYMARQTRQKVIQAMLHKASGAEYCGGNVPYGFMPVEFSQRINKQGRSKPIRRLEPHPTESKIVLFIKELYGYGRSDIFPIPEQFKGMGDIGASIITDILNSIPLKRRGDKTFDTAFVKKLIKDKYNYHIGTLTYCKTYGDKDERAKRGTSYRPEEEVIQIPQAFPSIVPFELQLLCQRKITENASHSSRFTSPRSQYLGSGIFTCTCGGKMIGRTKASSKKDGKPQLRYMCERRYNKAGCKEPMIMADYLHEGLNEVVKLFLGNADNAELIVKHTAEIIMADQREQPKSIAIVRNKLQKIRQQKDNLVSNLMEAPELGKILSSKLIELDEEENSLDFVLKSMQNDQTLTGEKDLYELVRTACRDIFELWEKAPLSKKNLLLKELISTAEVNPQNKEVKYSLAIPHDRIFDKKTPCLGNSYREGCTEGLAEAHGNRTHLGSFSPPTPVLKTGRPTSDRRASLL